MATEQVAAQSRKLGSFEVLEELGQGGMGVVYLARQPALDRLVVLKKIRKDLVDDQNALERFQREARAAAAVHHQNVVGVYDCFQARGTHYIAQEFVEGEDLRQVLGRARRLPPRLAALILLEVARGMEEIHARGIVHRDLKPANVLLGRGGEVKIADFGIALEPAGDGLTRPGTLVGSIPYMSPEQLLGERVDLRSDLFLLGILFYEMVTGVPPFEESSEEAQDTLVERMQSGRFDSPRKHGVKVPWRLTRLIRWCLRGRPSQRPPSATVFRRRLERWLGRVSPADCRREIAHSLWSSGALQAADDRTLVRPLVQAVTSEGLLRRDRLPALAAGVLLIAVLALAVGSRFSGAPTDRDLPSEPAVAVEPGEASATPAAAAPQPFELLATSDPLEDPATDSFGSLPVEPASQLPPPEPARVKIVAWPWAEVLVDGESSIITPRAQPLELPPGNHTLVFRHPSFGRAEYEVDLEAGEERTVSHRFPGASRS